MTNFSKLTQAALLSVAIVAGNGALVPTAFAADEVNVSSGATMPGPGLAVRGFDVISYQTAGAPELGEAEFSHVYDGATYRFSSQENLNTFIADPERYAPAYGGFCAFGVALGKKLDGDPNLATVVDGKLYFNLNKKVLAKWSEDIPGNLAKANAKWGDIRSVAVGDL